MIIWLSAPLKPHLIYVDAWGRFMLFSFFYSSYFIQVENQFFLYCILSVCVCVSWTRNILLFDFAALNAFKFKTFCFFFACWMKRNINWRVTSDIQLIKRLTMPSKRHDRLKIRVAHLKFFICKYLFFTLFCIPFWILCVDIC